MSKRGLSWNRVGCVIAMAGVVQFIVCGLIAMRLYPGGNEFEPERVGYSFWQNSLSDLGREVAHNGQANPVGSKTFNISMAATNVCLAAMWMILPGLFASQRRNGLAVRILGGTYAAGMVAVAATPTDTMHWWHMSYIGVMAVAGVTGLMLCCAGMARERSLPKQYALGTMVVLALGSLHFLQYAYHFWFGGPWTPMAPLVQKLLLLCSLAWIVVLAAKIWRLG